MDETKVRIWRCCYFNPANNIYPSMVTYVRAATESAARLQADHEYGTCDPKGWSVDTQERA